MRKARLLAMVGVFVAALACGGQAAHEPLHLVAPTNSVFVLSINGAIDAGIYEKWGFAPVELDVLPFAGYTAAFPAREVDVSNYSGITTIRTIANEKLPWVIIGEASQ
jgi:hypothetical protein